MEHDGEIWQEYDAKGERVMNGGVIPGDSIEDGHLYGGVAVMLYRFKNGKVEYLFQHRSKMLKANAGKWDVSAGGHINYDEPKLNSVIRETKEEIGAELEKENLEFAASYVRMIFYTSLYFYDYTYEKDEFSFYDNEVEEVQWVSEDNLDEFVKKLKLKLSEDSFFVHYLKVWAEKIHTKYGNLES